MQTDQLWYKDAIFYELHIRAFQDSNSDGVGDFVGARQKLGYLQELGVTCLWLLPFYQSPLRDDGYDVSDYYQVHPAYGTLQDVRDFVEAAHAQGIRVIADLVLNHTSDQHPWFLEARSSPTSPKRDFYVWSDTDQKYRDARVIFHSTERSNWTYDPVAHAYYWHRFFHHQPDLNYDNPEVQREMLKVVHFWLNVGFDGFRCDAVPHLFEREGTSCENLPETHAYAKALRRELERSYPGCVLLSEVNQSPADTAAYFGDADEFHMAFHFPLVARLFMALRREDRQPLSDILSQTPPIPDTCQWATFLRNHDEMTLSRMTPEEREFLLCTYASLPQARLNSGIRRRLAPLLENDLRQILLAHSLIFSLPGSPVLYYGDEIGMGDDLSLEDRCGLRTPMQWSSERNAGFSQADPERLYLPVIADPVYGYTTVNVEAQRRTETSLFRQLQRLLAIRKRVPALRRGSLALLHPDNQRVFVYLRRYGEETILVVNNLSHSRQTVTLELSQFQGTRPVDLRGNGLLSVIGKSPYLLALDPYDFHWLRLGHDGRA